ncbi:MAG: hypothetical protein LUI87_10740 [Lachnospiraceae bacterium]|nr:hypothetical protein [Lachnospiraceae bacterium]
MSEKEKKTAVKDNKKAVMEINGNLGHTAALWQVLRLVLYTSVIWNIGLYRICRASGSGNILRIIGLGTIFALYILGIGILYEKRNAGMEIVLRFILPLFLLVICNGIGLVLTMLQFGSDSNLFRNGLILTILSVLVFLMDFIRFLVSVLRWKISRKRNVDQAKQKTDLKESVAETDCAKTMDLPEKILRRVSDVILVMIVLVGYMLMKLLLPSGPMNAPLLQLALLMIFVCLVAIVFAYRICTKILSIGKYKLHWLDEKEGTDE